jgi:tRNA A37 threonylcarbamoyladenosine biosynthesis protein TsaE
VQDSPIGALGLRHVDLYRLAAPGALQVIGLDAPESAVVWLVEWPARGAGHLDHYLHITLSQGRARDARRADLRAGPRWRERLLLLDD